MEERIEDDVIVVVMTWPSDEVDIVTNVVCDVELVTRADVIVVLLVLESEEVEGTDEELVVVKSELVVDEAAPLVVVGVVVAEVGGGVLLAAPESVVVVEVSVSVAEPCAVDVFELPVPRL